MADIDYYKILKVSRDATSAEIRAAYRHLAKQYHPDAAPTPFADQVSRMMQAINDAYETLGDAEKRAEYDAKGRSNGAPASEPAPAPVQRRDTPPVPKTNASARRPPTAEVSGSQPVDARSPGQAASPRQKPPDPTAEVGPVVGLILLASGLYSLRVPIHAVYKWLLGLFSGSP
jgi:curved DNA-binding protein CbpA